MCFHHPLRAVRSYPNHPQNRLYLPQCHHPECCNILDGGTGADTIYSGGGSDTIVLRAGDGGSTLAAADIIADFTDGTDVLVMDDGLQYTNLTIAQGTGSNSSDTIISAVSEYLAILTGISASNINYFDFASMATGNQSFTGTTGDDVFIGAAGVDTVTTNIGTDIVLTSSGNDAITIDGVGNKTIDGGAGTDSLTISVSGISSLSDYTFTTSGDYLVLTDASSNAIQYKNIETLTVGSYTYIEDTSNDTYWNATEKVLYMYDGGGHLHHTYRGLSQSHSNKCHSMCLQCRYNFQPLRSRYSCIGSHYYSRQSELGNHHSL